LVFICATTIALIILQLPIRGFFLFVDVCINYWPKHFYLVVFLSSAKISYSKYKARRFLRHGVALPMVVMTVVEKNRAPENFHCVPNRYGMNFTMFDTISWYSVSLML